VDNICHTLVGAAVGEAGLKRRTRYGNATLMMASNLPDVDVLVFFTDTSGLSFRRGWTHGIVAQLLLPAALAAVIWLLDRVARRRRDPDAGPPLHAGWLLLLSYVGVYSHVFLDLLNNYGIRLLAPLDWRWFYGDAVFIIDPWLWLALGAGIWVTRRTSSEAPARASLVFAAGYIAAMILSVSGARNVVADVWRETRGSEPQALMVGPLALTPFTRVFIVDAGDRYESGVFTWWPTEVRFDPEATPKHDRDPAVIAARQSRDIREFLVWSRFPFWTVEPVDGGTRVTVRDMRFINAGRQFSASTVVDGDR
jgi:inner membrane protein